MRIYFKATFAEQPAKGIFTIHHLAAGVSDLSPARLFFRKTLGIFFITLALLLLYKMVGCIKSFGSQLHNACVDAPLLG
jgi:hypothetical protein